MVTVASWGTHRTIGAAHVATFALLGVGIGHLAEYLALLPSDHPRHAVLAYTGDDNYVVPAVVAGAMLLLIASVATFVPAVRRGMASAQGRPLIASRAVLPATQALAFGVLEVGERLLSHSQLPELGPVLVVGLPLQLLVGWLLTVLTVGLARSGERVGRMIAIARSRPHRAPAVRVVPRRDREADGRFPVVLEPPRGPPHLPLSLHS